MRSRALAVALAFLALAPTAEAATTVGQNFTPTAQVGTRATVLQSSVAAGASYTVPYDGVLTAWSFRAGATTEPMKFKVGRNVSSSAWEIRAESETVTPAPDQLNTFPIRIPVATGDVIGFFQDTGNTPAGARTDSDADQLAYSFGSDNPPGSQLNYFQVSRLRMNVAAQLELDADRDGFGDETQDLCATDELTQGPCTADLGISVRDAKRELAAYEEFVVEIDLVNLGRSIALGTRIEWEVPQQLEVVSVAPTGRCGGRAVLRCTFGDLPVGQPQSVAVRVRARAGGRVETKLTANSELGDPEVGNNTFQMAMSISFKTGTCANRRSGNDEANALFGGAYGDVFTGLGGHDLLVGAAGGDCLDGGPGNDRVIGGGGADRLTGGLGADSISGGSGNDRISPGPDRDRVSAGSGDDAVSATDGERDSVDCGPGKRDRVRADRIDRVRRCERVVRG